MSRLRSRPAVIVTVLAGAGLVVLAGGRPWVGQTVTGLPGLTRVTVDGGQAAPAVTALALVAAAGAVALGLTGRVARRVVAGVVVLAGLGMIVLVGTVLRDPAAAIAPALRAASGRTGSGSATPAAGAPGLTGWPWPAMAGGLLTVLGGSVGATAGAGWAGPGRRFEIAAGTAGTASTAGAPGDPGPAGAGGDAGSTGGPGGGQVQSARVRRERAVQDWDALSRGEDPTER